MSSESKLSMFLQLFSPISLHHREPKFNYNPWVFWSESEGCENQSSSADLSTTPMIHHNIKSVLSYTRRYSCLFVQFWAPVTIDSRRLLSTSHQPFAVRPLSNNLAKYRLHSEKYKYNIDDANKLDTEPEHMILSSGPATAFLNCRTSIDKPQGFVLESDNELISVMVPICFPFQSNCIGVLQFTFENLDLASFLFDTVEEIKDVGLDVFYVQHLIPYKAISGLEVTKDEIEKALKVVCESHNLALAQVWIPYEDKYNEPFSYFLEDSQTKGLSAIKLTSHLYAVVDDVDDDDDDDDADDVSKPYRFGDVILRAIGKELPLVTLQDYKSRYMSNLHSDRFMEWSYPGRTSALSVCLRSNDTADINYAFEFIWIKQSNYVILLEAILLTLKRCLPRFKFASGAELDDELDVILVSSSTDDETQKLKIFQEKRSSQMQTAPEKGKSPMVMDLIAPSMVTCKTAPKVLPREVIEKHFGKTMKEAAKDLNVSLSTLKRKVKEHRILEWQGPNFVKRNRNDSSIIQINTNEEENGAIDQGISTLNLNKDVLTLKAEYSKKIIKLHLPISQATFVAVEKEIGMKLKLSVGTFELEYIDEDQDWISLTSDEDMNDCIQSSRKRMRVLPSPQPVSGPSGSLGTFSV